MKGIILNIDVKNGSGVIQGENKELYKFDMTGWIENSCYPTKGMAVNFEVGASFSACKITIDTSKSQSTKKLASKKLNKLGFFLIAFCLLSVWGFSKGISFLEDYQKKSFSTVVSSPVPTVEPTVLESTSNNNEKKSNKDLIVGKWRWIETYTKTTKDNPTLTSKADNYTQGEIEYFEDNTYVEKSTNWGENGEWIVLSDGRIKKTRESCANTECKKAIRVHKISLPDLNTLHFDEKNNGSGNFYSMFSVYKRM